MKCRLPFGPFCVTPPGALGALPRCTAFPTPLGLLSNWGHPNKGGSVLGVPFNLPQKRYPKDSALEKDFHTPSASFCYGLFLKFSSPSSSRSRRTSGGIGRASSASESSERFVGFRRRQGARQTGAGGTGLGFSSCLFGGPKQPFPRISLLLAAFSRFAERFSML